MIRIDAPINPVPFKRVMANGKRRFNNAKYTEFKEELGFFALKAMGGREPLKSAVRVRAHFSRRKPRKLTSRLWGDVDNHLKSVLDALNGICYVDDAQVIEVTGTKTYGEPRVLIEVEEVEMTTTVTCEQCGKTFTGWETRRFCDECRRERNRAYMRKYNAAHRNDEQWLEKRRAAGRRYQAARRAESAEKLRQWRARKKMEAQTC